MSSTVALLGRLDRVLPRGRTLPEVGFRRRHRIMCRLLWAHVVVLPLVALGYGATIRHAVFEAGLIAFWATAATLKPGGRRTQALVGGTGLLVCSATLVHATEGLIEAHFHFFVIVTLLSLYEDWAVFGLSIGFVLLHHGLGAGLFDSQVFNHGGSAWKWAAVHTFFIAWLCLVNVIVWKASEHARGQLFDAQHDVRRHAAELERSNADLQEFAYVASHDLSEPLRMITSYLQLLERRYGDKLDDDAQQFIGFAVDGAARMRTLIDDLLRYSRLEREPHSPERVDVRETVDTTLRSLAAAMEETRAEVEVEPLPVVSGDPGQLSQLFQNLIANALKFQNGDPPHVEVAAEREAAGWRFTVADNGIGIDPEHAERVFKMFQRLHNRDSYGGNGIGLAICRKIVDRHGGRIWVEPNPGGGSRFVFTIPDTPPEPALSETL